MLERLYPSFFMGVRALVDFDLGAQKQGFEGSPFGNMILKPKVVGFTGIFVGKIVGI